jgi:hypothetical protein
MDFSAPPNAHGHAGVIIGTDPNLARQHAADYVKGAEVAIRHALAAARKYGIKSVSILAVKS